MKRLSFVVAAMLMTASRCFAVDDGTSAPASAPVDKRQFTFFDPVPVDLMRDMDTDRPDRTNSPITIDAGHVQLEVGGFDYVFERNMYQGANGRSDFFTFGEVNARIGLTYNVEFNIVIDPLDVSRNTDFTSGHSERQNGYGETVIGGKINLFGNDAIDDPWTVSLGIQPQFKFPTARRDIGNGHAEASLGFPLYVNLPQGFHLALQTLPQWERNDTNTGDRLGWQNAASIDRNVAPGLDVYIEYWSHLSPARHQIAQQTIDTGFVFTINSYLQIDAGVFLGLNRATPSFECTSGFSIRF